MCCRSRFFTDIVPGTRVSSSNYDPVPAWQAGVQIVALNWQDLSDEAMMLK